MISDMVAGVYFVFAIAVYKKWGERWKVSNPFKTCFPVGVFTSWNS